MPTTEYDPEGKRSLSGQRYDEIAQQAHIRRVHAHLPDDPDRDPDRLSVHGFSSKGGQFHQEQGEHPPGPLLFPLQHPHHGLVLPADRSPHSRAPVPRQSIPAQ